MSTVLGPILIILYVAEVFDIITSYGCEGHSYTDDTHQHSGNFS